MIDLPDDVSRSILWGVPLWQFAAATFLIFAGLVCRRLVAWIFSGFLKRKAAQTKIEWDDDAVELLPGPLALIVVVLLWYVAVALMLLPTEPIDVRLYVFHGLKAAVAAAFTWLLFRIVDVLARALGRASAKTETKLDDQVIPLARKTGKVVLGLTAGVMIVQNLGYSVTSVLASLGVGGLALALAAKDTVSNFFGSIVVFTDRPFQVGDWVEFDGVEGTVEEVGFRTTRVRRFDKSLVSVPNQTFSTNAIVNHSQRPIRRIVLSVGLTYDTTPKQMRAILESVRKLLADHEAIDQGFHFVHFTDFGASSLDLQVYCFTKSTVWVEYLAAREDVLLRIMDAVEEHGSEIAFPTRTVHLKSDADEAPRLPQGTAV